MNKYLVVYHAPPSFSKKMEEVKSEDKMAEMGRWQKWFEASGDAMVDMGAPLSGGTNVVKSGKKTGESDVVGYSIIQAKTMDAAKKIMKTHPHLMQDNSCAIEIHESAPLPGQ